MTKQAMAPESDVLRQVRVRLIGPEERDRFDQLLEQKHYLQSARMGGQSLRCVAEVAGQWMALITFSGASPHTKAREQKIRWTPRQRARRLCLVVNNSRFLVLPQRYPNLASRVLALCLKGLNADWQEHWGHPVVLVESYVDESQYRGTSYRACGFAAVGLTAGENTNAQGPSFGIGDIETLVPGGGFGVEIIMGATAYSVSDLTLEYNGSTLPAAGLDVQVLALGNSGSSQPAPALVPYGQLGNPMLSTTRTPWPGFTSFINFTPTSPIILQPNTSYVIGASEVANGNDDNALLFGMAAAAYTYEGGVNSAVQYNESANNWMIAGSHYEGAVRYPLVLQLNGTAVPFLAAASFTAQTNFEMNITGAVGYTYQVQWSANLGASAEWSLLTNVTLQGATQPINDPSPPAIDRFYRVVQVSP